ncbi:MAG: adenylate kinase [Firmicutes bacterium]|nr:adenylate kinase [Bacillota bacterium]
MRIVMLGPPGAGKGTQAKMLAEKLNVPHISTGDIFREAIRKKTDLGLLAKSFMDRGELVPDDVTMGIVKERISEPDCQKGFIFDGFPRTTAQAENLDGMLRNLGISLDLIVDIQVRDEEIVSRLENRRSCPACGMVYHLINNPPVESGLCDSCGELLVGRVDDTRQVILNRLKVYEEKTEPLKAYYSGKVETAQFDGAQEIGKVLEQIMEYLGRYQGKSEVL